MIRITSHQTSDELLLTLEGCLNRDSVDALDDLWRLTERNLGGRRLRVDLRGLDRVDDRGRSVLLRLHDSGAEFVASGCEIPEIVREMAGAAPRRFPERT